MTSGGSYDIFSRIRSILNTFGLSSKETPLKRRAPDQDEHPSMTKYRRVSNAFPQMRQFEEDGSFLHPRPAQSATSMADRKLSQHSKLNISNPNLSRTNTNTYADLEYSDDDDVIFTNPRSRTVNTSMKNASSLNCFNNKNHSNVIFPDHIPVIVRNTKASTSLTNPGSVNKSKSTTFNGHLSDIPPLIPAFNYNRESSVAKSDTLRDTWHKRLTTAKSTRDHPVKTMPGLIEAKTGKLAATSIPVDYAGSFGKTRPYMNGIDHSMNETKMTNGMVAESFEKVSQQRSPLMSQRKTIANSSTEKAFNIRDRNSYLELLKKIVPALYKSNDPVKNRQQLARLSLARGAGKKNQNVVTTINLTDDENDRTIIDLSKDDETMVSACEKLQDDTTDEIKSDALPYVEPVNSLKDRLDTAPNLKPDWLEKMSNSYKEKAEKNKNAIIEATENARKASKETAAQEYLLIENLRKTMVLHEPIFDEEEEEEEDEFPEFTDEQRSLIKRAIYRGSPDEVLISKFNMNITRRDITTLLGESWLNDEVINFYMNLLMERSEMRSSDGLPRVYAMNTFFVPRLLQSGHSGVRRWTRKVDIFSYDVIPVPVHVGQVHWCMAIIHLKNRTIKYYDSMGTPNPRLLNALEDYLKEESLDKRKEPFDTSKFSKESVAEAPRQMNGSDCGVFSCMFAEYITRNRQITFNQQHMPYFRQKMVLEIVQGKLLL